MSKRWKAIIKHMYRFKAIVSSWASEYSFLFRNKTGISFATILRSKFQIFFGNNALVEFYSRLHQLGKNIMGSIITAQIIVKIRSKWHLKYSDGFKLCLQILLKKLISMRQISSIEIGFVSKLMRKLFSYGAAKIEVSFLCKCLKKGQLYFNNRKLTTHTLSMVKSLTIEKIKQKTIDTIKREWRTIPQFKTEFAASLQKK